MAKQQTPYKMTRLSEIRPYDRNPRIIPQAAVDAVAKSIAAFGFRQPIVVDGHGVILAGHTRYRAAQQLGLAEVPVVWQTDITDIQARGYRIADNKTAEIAAWDRDALDAEVRELADMDDGALASLGMSDWELDRILHECTGGCPLEEIQPNARPQVPSGGAVQPPSAVAQAPVSYEQSAEQPDESGCAQSFRIVAVFDTQAERDECVKMIAEKYGESVAIIG